MCIQIVAVHMYMNLYIAIYICIMQLTFFIVQCMLFKISIICKHTYVQLCTVGILLNFHNIAS